MEMARTRWLSESKTVYANSIQVTCTEKHALLARTRWKWACLSRELMSSWCG